MDERKLAFIVCITDNQYYEECVKYLADLTVPEGYCTDILSVTDVASMAEGYNEAMQASDAKYKVYLREDVFLLNRNFIADVLDILKNDAQIGMIGVRGTDRLPEDADFGAAWNIGNIREYDGRCIKDTFELRQAAANYEKVAAVDGVLMVTQYDVPWREDLSSGWNLYGVSQSIEMRRQGYEVVVPRQEQPWCYCDNSILSNRDYDICREGLMRIYPEIFPAKETGQEREQHRKEQATAVEMRQALAWLMEMHLYNEARGALGKQRFNWMPDMQAQEIVNMMEIYFLEEASVSKQHSSWFVMQSWSEIYAFYQKIRWTVLRLGYERADERIAELKCMVDAGEISKDAIRKIANVSLPDTTGVFRYFWTEKREQPLVSVCVAVYNAGEFLHETLDSVLNQTYNNIEFLVVDDCSTDNSREVITSWQKKDSRVIPVFLEKNSNVCAAGNAGFERAKGTYVAIIGHDDVWRPDKLEKQVAFLEEHPDTGACFTWGEVIDEKQAIVSDNNRLIYQAMNADNNSAENWLRRMILDKSNWACTPSVCVRKSVLDRVGYYRYGLVQLQDFELWLRILSNSSIYVLQEKLTWYRRFTIQGKNLSNLPATEGKVNRLLHEMWWSVSNAVEKMDDKRFLHTFADELRWKEASSHEAVMCEKAFLLWHLGGSRAESYFINLLENVECRNTLEHEYHFCLNDFYALNEEA